MEDQPTHSDDDPKRVTPPDPPEPAVPPPPDPPVDKGPSLPEGPFTGSSAAPFGAAMQDDAGLQPVPPPAPEPPAPVGPGGWVPEIAPPEPPPAYPEPAAAPPPAIHPVADPVGEPAPPAAPGFDPPSATPWTADAAPEQPVERAQGSIPPPGYTPQSGGYGYGGGPVPPGAYAAEAPAPQPLGTYQLASWGSRAAALIIDGVIISVASLVLVLLAGAIFGSLGSLGGDSGGAIGFWLGVVAAFIPVIIVSLAYQPYWMARTNGQTIGKSALGIRVIRTSGQDTDLGWSALRQVVVIQLLFGVVGSFFFSIPWLLNYLWPLWDEENRALHDMLVSSRVVKA